MQSFFKSAYGSIFPGRGRWPKCGTFKNFFWALLWPRPWEIDPYALISTYPHETVYPWIVPTQWIAMISSIFLIVTSFRITLLLSIAIDQLCQGFSQSGSNPVQELITAGICHAHPLEVWRCSENCQYLSQSLWKKIALYLLSRCALWKSWLAGYQHKNLEHKVWFSNRI